jgi:hypothetical protein
MVYQTVPRVWLWSGDRIVLVRRWAVPGFLQTWHLAFRSKSSISVSSDQRILLSWSESTLGALWQTPSGLSCAFYWGVASVWQLYYKGLIGGGLQRWLSIWKVTPFPHRLWSSVRVTIWLLVTSLTKVLLPRLLSLAVRTAPGRVLVVPNFFHLRMIEATVFLGTFSALVTFLRFLPRHNPVF